MFREPEVSVIIPAHNAAESLAATLRSVCDQTWKPIEIIVVDDWSSDNTREVAEGFRSSKIRLFPTPPGRSGACAARNVGLEQARGDYIQYLDADDLLSPAKIENQLRLLESLPSGYVASCRWGKFHDSITGIEMEDLPVFADFEPLDWLLTAWQGGGMMQTACWLTPRSVAEKAGLWDETLPCNPADDGEYFCRILLRSLGVRFCTDAEVYYRTPEEGNLSLVLSDAAVNALFMNCEHYREQALQIEDSERVRQALMVNYARFIYRFHPQYSDLINKARSRIHDLGFVKIPPDATGGKSFRAIAAVAGFDTALKFRKLLCWLK